MNKLVVIICLVVALCLYSCVNTDSVDNESTFDSAIKEENDTLKNNSGYVRIDTTYNLYVFYPRYKSIELQIDSLPVKGKDVLYAAPLAYTVDKMNGGIVGSFCKDGVCYSGQKRDTCCNGCFYVTDKGFSFVYNKDWKNQPIEFFVAFLFEGIECGASQEMLIFKGAEVVHKRLNTDKYKFRALCVDSADVLCIAESRDKVKLGFFVQCLLAYKMNTALYMDMGGWDYACWRTDDDSLHITGNVHQTYSNMIVFK